MVPTEVYEEKDEKDSPPDSQNFTIGSKVYNKSLKWNSPVNSLCRCLLIPQNILVIMVPSLLFNLRKINAVIRLYGLYPPSYSLNGEETWSNIITPRLQ